MNYKALQNKLEDFNQDQVGKFIAYLKALETEKDRNQQIKNKWFKYFSEDQAETIFRNVAIDNLIIDGETVTLQFKGKVMASYNYQAYKNKLLAIYPESQFDIQLVTEGDEFSFRKESGKVIYTHRINNPFSTDQNIIGTYCVIKNSRGEFLETLNMTEIQKMKSVAKTQNIWNDWFGEMVLKSVIKRACKRHFRDVIQNIELNDNENYSPENVGFDEALRMQIEGATTIAELTKVYEDNKNTTDDEVRFVALLGERKQEIIDNLPEITNDDLPTAVQMLKDGKTKKELRLIWKIDEDTMQNLILEAV